MHTLLCGSIKLSWLFLSLAFKITYSLPWSLFIHMWLLLSITLEACTLTVAYNVVFLRASTLPDPPPSPCCRPFGITALLLSPSSFSLPLRCCLPCTTTCPTLMPLLHCRSLYIVALSVSPPSLLPPSLCCLPANDVALLVPPPYPLCKPHCNSALILRCLPSRCCCPFRCCPSHHCLFLLLFSDHVV